MALALLGATLAPATASAVPEVTISSTQKLHPFLQYGAQADPLRVARVGVADPSQAQDDTQLLWGPELMDPVLGDRGQTKD